LEYQVYTLKDRPDLTEALKQLNRKSWPDFIIHGDTFSWSRIYHDLNDFLLLLTDKDDSLIGGGFTVPVPWNGTFDDLPSSNEKIIARGLENSRASANTLIAVAALVDKRFRGHNISAEILKQMKSLAIRRGLQHLIVPVRPTWKARYPLQSIESYSTWRNKDGFFYDPWLRTHQRLGATVMTCVDSTLTVRGTIADWENWTGMVFPESGEYVVKDALEPVRMDVASDVGIYHEPNVWMQHPLSE
jgi:hypothetical protein